MLKSNNFYPLFCCGLVAAIVYFAFPDLVWALSTADSIDGVTTGTVSKVPDLINGFAFAGGAALGVSGALKLKAYAENPAQEKIAAGIGRLLAGGALASLPTLIATMIETLHLEDTAIDLVNFGMWS